ncbi:TRAP transporter large permease [Enterocloster sp. OA13]|uniref:TRAP transporter large permease n=1 Tax=Enterocloster hominis (ex Hitch et al. 2024) TaxID=1917870 RepID=A0ABV1D3X6_9FIRM|nr:TRAP transporter large permease subunit [Lachnoclostridium pacaense]EEQ56378.1 TRAP transporter, DctM subunit [Clostridiales bacterium 1_7_47FAA]MCC2820191.1 TRAP transporter large permease [Lachnoclostridium pacaense]MCH1948857.1 TRAP transporter large permease [Enterocloster sp. OA13]
MAAILFISLIILIAIGMPLAYALGGASFFAIASSDLPSILTVQRFFTGVDSFTLMAIPFFMISGSLMSKGGVSDRLIKLCSVFLRKLPGGLAIVTVVACTFFGAISGSAPATAAAIGGIMIPAMLANKYAPDFSMSTVASAGYLGVIIPPSITMVTYGVAAGASIGDMFMAGVFPGILLCLGMSIFAYLVGRKNNYVMQDERDMSSREILKIVIDAIPALLMPVIILGGIYGGIFTPTEAGCVSVVYGLFVGFFVYKELKLGDIPEIFRSSALSASMILLIIGCASAFGNIITREMIPNKVASLIIGISDNKIVFLILVNVLLLIVGCFMETNTAIMIIAPILLPVAKTLGIDVIHFGIIMVINLAIGLLTPPLGMNLYVATGITGKKVSDILGKYLFGYIAISIIILLIITYVPAISTFLPQLVAGR